MPKRITELTESQKARMPEWVEKWIRIGLSTEPGHWPSVVDGIRRCYIASGLKPPLKVIPVASPIAAVICGPACEKLLTDAVRAGVRDGVAAGVDAGVQAGVAAGVWDGVSAGVEDGVEDGVRAGVWAGVAAGVADGVQAGVEAGVRAGVWDGVEAGVEDGVADGVWAGVRDGVADGVRAGVWAGVAAGVDAAGVWDGVWAGVRDGVEAGVADGVRAGVRDGVADGVWDDVIRGNWSRYFGGSFWAGWQAFQSFLIEVCGLDLGEKLNEAAAAYQLVSQNAGWWWPGTYVAYVSARPTHLSVININGVNRLHNDHGPSISWSDGYCLWHIRGVQVNKQIVMQPETQTITQINAETNSDVKSIRIERFGWTRYLREINAKCIDECKNDVEGTREALFVSADGMRRFVATCPTGRSFTMGVPQEIATCEQARTWLQPKPFRILART